MPTCEGTRRDGKPCAAQALPSDPYCWAHSEKLKAEREAARSEGGKHSAKAARLQKLMPPRLVPIFETLETALTEVHDGKITPPVAQAMGRLATALVAVLAAGEQEERLRRIEETLAGMGEEDKGA